MNGRETSKPYIENALQLSAVYFCYAHTWKELSSQLESTTTHETQFLTWWLQPKNLQNGDADLWIAASMLFIEPVWNIKMPTRYHS